jgi:hypothetical protein
MADAINGTASLNHHLPALWQKRAFKTGRRLIALGSLLAERLFPPDEAVWPGRVAEANNGPHETTERTAIVIVRPDPWTAASAAQAKADHHV